MALNSRRLLQSLSIAKVTIVGHSIGGMLSACFAASFPDITERAVIYDPIGLTDPRYERPCVIGYACRFDTAPPAFRTPFMAMVT
jgi:pimeloyl-ACP methyl ester carboxylesterase